MTNCPHCAAPLENLLSCAACTRLLAVADDASPFAIFALQPSFEVDARDLRKKLLRTSRAIHPDFHATSTDAERALAEKNSAVLNQAYEILADDAARASWLVASLGGPDENEERAMPKSFLLEVLDWNETLEEARASAAFDPRLVELETSLRAKRDESLAGVRGALTPLPEPRSPKLREARSYLNAIRYVDRALNEIESLRLAKTAAP